MIEVVLIPSSRDFLKSCIELYNNVAFITASQEEREFIQYRGFSCANYGESGLYTPIFTTPINFSPSLETEKSIIALSSIPDFKFWEQDLKNMINNYKIIEPFLYEDNDYLVSHILSGKVNYENNYKLFSNQLDEFLWLVDFLKENSRKKICIVTQDQNHTDLVVSLLQSIGTTASSFSNNHTRDMQVFIIIGNYLCGIGISEDLISDLLRLLPNMNENTIISILEKAKNNHIKDTEIHINTFKKILPINSLEKIFYKLSLLKQKKIISYIDSLESFRDKGFINTNAELFVLDIQKLRFCNFEQYIVLSLSDSFTNPSKFYPGLAKIFTKENSIISCIGEPPIWLCKANRTNNIKYSSTKSCGIKIPQDLMPKKISATGLKLLMNEPYQYYIKYILGIKAEEVSSKKSLLGITIHKALEEAATLEISLSEKDYILKFKKILEAAIIKHSCEIDINAKKLAKSFLTYQTQDIILETYTEFYAECEYFYEDDKSITIYAKIDRIDFLEDGSIRVIDYKTGSLPSLESISRGLEPQLPVYAYVLNNNQKFKNKDIKFLYLKLDLKTYSFEERVVKIDIDYVKKNLELAIKHFWSGDFIFTEDKANT
ncbi:PD-(D/E)XK nuclease family protein [Candidatus Cyrtobacter comes]|uniref:PD-(D/E)XK nuclease family protein n=1 Tax=Candidatus Cyrtobacter comes TaxID=675776 RepID=A0ABU5L8Z8_9RICK|nr:PD-(D/E)XK nuclease family protein [Candidatus Cyrtobacter comes]MDZ5762603.1 PD-(D/E)XK nuclease family protein [Candidatus Cyrtobacter comes]